MYKDTTVYLIGHGRTNADNAITKTYQIFFINFIVDTTNDEIVDLSCTAMLPTTSEFVKSLFIGKKFDKYYCEIENEILNRYFGSSQKAIIIAYKDALKKYLEIKDRK